MSIADIVKTLREYSNMTQDEFAKQVAGVTFQAVSTWERGEREPRMGVIQKLSDYYGVPKSLLIDGNTTDLLRFLKTNEGHDNHSDRMPSNGDLSALREQLRRQPGMRILFDAGKNATEQDLLDAAALIEGFKRRRDGEE